ncbi:hypothetical protein ACFONC_11775 [Luteimonas soli]|uniref:Uncharacterized protein n=1 Tax=Luteimonas soli TaxID=1648966 RepID=A0ABV7XKY8_9GAMM
MGQVSLNREDMRKVLADPDAGADATLIAAAGTVYFEAMECAAAVDGATVQIAQKLLRMAAHAIDEEREGVQS